MATNSSKKSDEVEEKQGSGCFYVKVSMDGAPYLRKVDLKLHPDYKKLSLALEKMFGCFTIGNIKKKFIYDFTLNLKTKKFYN